MRKAIFTGLVVLLLAGAWTAAGQDQPQSGSLEKPISWDNWRAAKDMAVKSDEAGKYVEALQYYLEYTRQAEGLGNMELVAWGKNNAAYMIIKRHKQDSTVDLAPAKKFLEEGMAIDKATDDCKKCLATNMEYVNLFLKK